MPDASRPNPDSLLSIISKEETSKKRGHLKIFFGSCAGVGKTYTMLESAHSKKKQGFDVVIGVIETHQRSETEALIGDLEIIPQKKVKYKDVFLKEFDIDKTLARKPALILVDELAHTNAPGSRNLKRWQDLQELLQAGIDVYTTLNVQHLETVNDKVAKIAGVIVRETVPDSIFDQADEVELIDLPVAELLQRLKEGKVYMPEQAGRATENFFQEGNLIALREIALRKTAQRVDSQMHQYRTLHSVRDIWQAVERCLVCVGPSPFSTQLIRRTKELANELKSPWVAVYVEVLHKQVGEEERELIEKQLRFAESLGAETVILQGLDPSEEILKFAREKNVTKIVVGKPTHARWRDLIFGSFVDRLIRGSGDIDVYSIHSEEKKNQEGLKFSRPLKGDVPWSHYLIPLAFIFVWTAFFRHFSKFELIDLAMTYLMINVLVSLRFGQGPAIVSAIASIATFDFFFVPPYYTFSVSNGRYLITFIVMFAVTVLTSRLMVRLRQSAEAASARERYTANLYALGREMLKSRTTKDISTNAANYLSRVIEGDVVILVGSQPEFMFLEGLSTPDWHFDDVDRAVAQWVCKNGKVAGFGTQTLPSSKAIFFPMMALRGVIGVIGVRPHFDEVSVASINHNFMESVVSQAALAIERAMLAEEAKESEMNAEREGLISSLLSSVSHDLRTPLTSIAGSASTLLTSEGKLSPENQRRLLETINSEADRLNRLLKNILQITKIDSGNIQLRKKRHSLEEIVGSALTRLEPFLLNRKITTHIPESLPLVPLDDLLIEQVVINLLENAIRYTPSGSPIDIRVFSDEKNVDVEVLDRGPGVLVSEQGLIFQKFYRSQRKDAWGSGLGLAICHGIIKAHGGKIGMKNREEGGSIFYFTLPLIDYGDGK